MHEKPQILVVDDDLHLRDALTIYLSKRDWRVVAVSNGQDALQEFLQRPADLVALDVMMPGMDGWELCQRLRQISDVPIIMLSARGQDYDRIKGLSVGADDYLVKPFGLRELETRIQALLQRSQQIAAEAAEIYYDDGTLRIDGRQQQVVRNGQPVNLSNTERRLLFLLAENLDHTLPASRILQVVWGPEYLQRGEYIDTYVWRLRQKIEPDPDHPVYLITEVGGGYRLARQPARRQ
jgi:two-component system KDP operon response regulator KdpE